MTNAATIRVSVQNDFHGSSAEMTATLDGTNECGEHRVVVSADAADRASRRLCGMDDCQCGGSVGVGQTVEESDYSEAGQSGPSPSALYVLDIA